MGASNTRTLKPKSCGCKDKVHVCSQKDNTCSAKFGNDKVTQVSKVSKVSKLEIPKNNFVR